MAYSNSYMFLSIGVFVILSSQTLAYNVPSEPLTDGGHIDKKGINYVMDSNTVAYKMPPEPPTYPEINEKTLDLDDKKSTSEHLKETAERLEEALNDILLRHLKRQKLVYNSEETIDNQNTQEYVESHKLAAACESPPNPLTDVKIDEEAIADEQTQEIVKAQKIAACESPPNPLTDAKVNEEAIDDQKAEEYVKAQKIAACESPPIPLTGSKINDDQINKAEPPLDDQQSLEDVKAQKIDTAADDESPKPLNDLEINESEVNWRSFHAKYPWIKKHGHKSIPGSRKLLNDDIANDQFGGLPLQI